MATLLRKAKLTMYSHFDISITRPPQPPPKDKVLCTTFESNPLRSKEWSRIDLSTAAEPAIGTEVRSQREEQANKQRSIAQLRRRLVRKASTFSLRNNSQKTHRKALTKHPASQSFVFNRGTPDTNSASDQNIVHSSTIADSQLHQSGATQNSRVSTTSTDDSCVTAIGTATATEKEENFRAAIDYKALGAERESSRPQQFGEGVSKNSQVSHKESKGSGQKMAAPAVEPPVSYEKLKQITTDACDTALSSVTTYNHSDTEAWNTSIINTILAALVNETSAESTTSNGAGGSPPQPSFKFVVNSTIIQHGATSTSEDGKTSGRRGMHSASGAYWNNEKDGMWSFKYEAAEAKGLDVVIGIIWVWVG